MKKHNKDFYGEEFVGYFGCLVVFILIFEIFERNLPFLAVIKNFVPFIILLIYIKNYFPISKLSKTQSKINMGSIIFMCLFYLIQSILMFIKL